MDGAIFLLAFGANPEVILVIEARRPDAGAPTWQYEIGRLPSAAPSVSLGKEVVWNQEYQAIMTPRDSYYNGWLVKKERD